MHLFHVFADEVGSSDFQILSLSTFAYFFHEVKGQRLAVSRAKNSDCRTLSFFSQVLRCDYFSTMESFASRRIQRCFLKSKPDYLRRRFDQEDLVLSSEKQMMMTTTTTVETVWNVVMEKKNVANDVVADDSGVLQDLEDRNDLVEEEEAGTFHRNESTRRPILGRRGRRLLRVVVCG